MKMLVTPLTMKQVKVLHIVVEPIFVDVVHNFRRKEFTADYSFHENTMFAPPILQETILSPSAFPEPVILARIR